MKPAAAATLLWLATTQSTAFASDSEVSVYAGHDFSPCETPSTARIEEGGCSTGFECTQYDGIGGFGNVTYYGQGSCSSSRDAYLQSAFGDAPYFMVEYYQDADCQQLSKSEVYRADDQCHFHTFGVMKIWVAQDKSMAALLSSSYCESDTWGVSLGLNVSVNTGECFDRGEYVKYVLVGDPVSGNSVRSVGVYTGYDDSSCLKPSTVKIDEAGCDEASQLVSECTAMDVGGTTYYSQSSCHETRDKYLDATFGDTSLFIVEYYEDAGCEELATSSVYLADGECHYFTLGTMKVWVADDDSMAALTVSGSCESDDWSVFMNLNGSVNTGACVPYGEYRAAAVKFVLTGTSGAASSQVSVSEGHDDSKCDSPSTAQIFEDEPCSGSSECVEYSHVGGWGNVTYYGHSTCSSSRDAYLESAFGESLIFMIEYYQDTSCTKRAMTEVYRADGQCHFHTLGVMKIWVAEDKSMAALLSSSHCKSDSWGVSLGLNVSVNTGECIPQSGGQWFQPEAVKYVLVDGSTTTTTTTTTTNGAMGIPIPSYGNSLWPVRDKSLCAIETGACREFTLAEVQQRDFMGLLQLSDTFSEHEQRELWAPGFDQGADRLPDQLLQLLLPVNSRLFSLWKSACSKRYDRTRPRELEACRCIHEQLVRGLSAARQMQRYNDWYELDSEWCSMLMQREQILYGKARPIMAALCDRGLNSKYFHQRRALLDSILC